jgi:hypothetical protein
VHRQPPLLGRAALLKQYEAKVEFETNDSTFEGLVEMGATHKSARERYPHLPSFEKCMKVPQVKLERNQVVSILLGESPDGVAFFNRNTIKIERLK